MTGGEPLVFKDFNEIFSKSNEKSETNIITNGLLLNDQKIKSFYQKKILKFLEFQLTQ